MSANVTTPIMIGIDGNGNYKAVDLGTPGETYTGPTMNSIGGMEPNSNQFELVEVSTLNTEATNSHKKLMVDQVKSFKTWKNYAYLNEPQTYYNTAINDAIGDWTGNYGARYDDIIISVVANGLGPNNFHYYVTITRWF
jgi:hypothetical protein